MDPDEQARGNSASPAGRAPASAAQMLLTQFAFGMVNRLFSVGLILASTQSLVSDADASNRVATAVNGPGNTIREMRTIAFSLISPREWPPLPLPSRVDTASHQER